MTKAKIELIFWLLMVVILPTITGLLWGNSLLLTIILILLSGVYFYFRHTREDLYFYFIALIVGPFGETIAIKLGAWYYAQPEFFGIPLWLPVLWGLSGIVLKNLLKSINQIWTK